MAELKQVTQDRCLCSITIPLVSSNFASPEYFRYFNTVSNTWRIPVPLQANKYRFVLTRYDLQLNSPAVSTTVKVVIDQVKQNFSPCQDFTFQVRALNLSNGDNSVPIYNPITFVGMVNGFLDVKVITADALSTSFSNLSSLYLTYDVYLE